MRQTFCLGTLINSDRLKGLLTETECLGQDRTQKRDNLLGIQLVIPKNTFMKLQRVRDFDICRIF